MGNTRRDVWASPGIPYDHRGTCSSRPATSPPPHHIGLHAQQNTPLKHAVLIPVAYPAAFLTTIRIIRLFLRTQPLRAAGLPAEFPLWMQVLLLLFGPLLIMAVLCLLLLLLLVLITPVMVYSIVYPLVRLLLRLLRR